MHTLPGGVDSFHELQVRERNLHHRGACAALRGLSRHRRPPRYVLPDQVSSEYVRHDSW